MLGLLRVRAITYRLAKPTLLRKFISNTTDTNNQKFCQTNLLRQVIDSKMRETEDQLLEKYEVDIAHIVRKYHKSNVRIIEKLQCATKLRNELFPRTFSNPPLHPYAEPNIAILIPELNINKTIDEYLQYDDIGDLHYVMFICANHQFLIFDKLLQRVASPYAILFNFIEEMKITNACKQYIYYSIGNVMKDARIKDIFSACNSFVKKCSKLLKIPEETSNNFVRYKLEFYDPDLIEEISELKKYVGDTNKNICRNLYFIVAAFANYASHRHDTMFKCIVSLHVPELFDDHGNISRKCKEYIYEQISKLMVTEKDDAILKMCEICEKKCLKLANECKMSVKKILKTIDIDINSVKFIH
jgi:hypothetical protein